MSSGSEVVDVLQKAITAAQAIKARDDEIARLSDALEAKDKLIEWHQAYEADLQRVIEAKDQRIADLEADNERLLVRLMSSTYGMRDG